MYTRMLSLCSQQQPSNGTLDDVLGESFAAHAAHLEPSPLLDALVANVNESITLCNGLAVCGVHECASACP